MYRFSFVFSLLCYGQVGLSNKLPSPSQQKNSSNSLWRPILTLLKSDPAPPEAEEVPLPMSNLVDQDLAKINQQEIKVVTDAWKAKASELKLTDQNEIRVTRNKFFHERVEELNSVLFSALEKTAATRKLPNKSYKSVAEKVLQMVKANPVANLENIQNFQQGGQIGFCFGRALLVHYLLLKEGVPQKHLAKIFTIGELMVGKVIWTFHVAVMVPDPVSGYLVVDPLHNAPVAYKEWLAINSSYDIKKPLSRTRFYLTDPRKFLPSFGIYDTAQLENPVLKSYFTDLAKTL